MFDNSQNKQDSKFAKFNEILIRRDANRDGNSNYYLNNTRCRRKDIREVFLGTGLGPRSYAIIEQGMISKIIDSKPEELRTYLEEAAGISKYKEKRRETELRLKHTSENLNRLKDIMREINSSLTKLQKQANDAESYKDLKKEEENIRIKIIGKKIINFDRSFDDAKKRESNLILQKDKFDSEMTGFNNIIDQLKLKRDDEQAIYNKVQSESFQIAAEIARAEKDIEYTEQIETSKKDNINDINNDINTANAEIQLIHKKQADNKKLIINHKKEKEELSKKINQINNEIKEASFSLQNWQSNFNKFLSDKIELEKEIELEKSKIESYSENISILEKRLDKQTEDDNGSTDKNVHIELLTQSESYQKELINLKVDFERHSNKMQNDLKRSFLSTLNSLLDKFKKIILKIKENNKSFDQQIQDIKNNIKNYHDKIIGSEQTLREYDSNLKSFEKHKNKLEKEKIDLKQTHDKLNWRYNEISENLNSNNVAITTLETQMTSSDENLNRLKANVKVLTTKKQELLSDSSISVRSDTREKLNTLINKKKEKDQSLTSVQDKITSIDNEIKDNDQKIAKLSLTQNDLNTNINAINIELTEIKTNKSSLLDNADFDKNLILQSIKNDDEISLKDKENELDKVKTRIDKLGAINLAAIDELKDHEDRKIYLDKQYDDLIKSVETLESAIKKIDTETKAKFKDTFDSINTNLSYFFPKIFGGGKAYLELTDNDLLNTGVNIMAKPPGKLVKNLNLLSGGEKAGTGIAFVFSIFRINPAPFCLLDEVDAPLDEANNERFCNVVKEMSETVQFIFITHNKSTMKIADVLSGVTMREAGVSKLVSVNVDDALEMATSN